MKRIILFGLTNVAVLVLLSFIARLIGLDETLARQGTGVSGLLMLASVIGFGGARVSLAMSKWIARTTMGVRIINRPETAAEAWLVTTVAAQAQRVGIGMPEVGIFDAPDMNDFATRASRHHAVAAVSEGLLRGTSREEAVAVLAHEITHVANGEMLTLALIQGGGQHLDNLPGPRDWVGDRQRGLLTLTGCFDDECEARERHEHDVELVEGAEDAAGPLEPAKRPFGLVSTSIPGFAVRPRLEAWRERSHHRGEAEFESELPGLVTFIRPIHDRSATAWQAGKGLQQLAAGRPTHRAPVRARARTSGPFAHSRRPDESW